MIETENSKNEPYFYIALVLKGSEKQYINLINYVDTQNGAKIIYQHKSLTYLRVVRDDGRPKPATTTEDTTATNIELRGVTQ